MIVGFVTHSGDVRVITDAHDFYFEETIRHYVLITPFRHCKKMEHQAYRIPPLLFANKSFRKRYYCAWKVRHDKIEWVLKPTKDARRWAKRLEAFLREKLA